MLRLKQSKVWKMLLLMLFLLQWQHHLKKESTTELFQETGLSGEPAPAIEMTTEEKILRQKYQNK